MRTLIGDSQDIQTVLRLWRPCTHWLATAATLTLGLMLLGPPEMITFDHPLTIPGLVSLISALALVLASLFAVALHGACHWRRLHVTRLPALALFGLCLALVMARGDLVLVGLVRSLAPFLGDRGDDGLLAVLTPPRLLWLAVLTLAAWLVCAAGLWLVSEAGRRLLDRRFRDRPRMRRAGVALWTLLAVAWLVGAGGGGGREISGDDPGDPAARGPGAGPAWTGRAGGRDPSASTKPPEWARNQPTPWPARPARLGRHEALAPPMIRLPGDRTVASFAIGRYEVTRAEWLWCVREGGCPPLAPAAPAGDGNSALPGKGPAVTGPDDAATEDPIDGALPVAGVGLPAVERYLAWLNLHGGGGYRLPGEAEWDYAARAGSETRYWWGEHIGPGLAHCLGCARGVPVLGPMAAGSLGPNRFGLHETAGNVWEWVQAGPTGARPTGEGMAVARGGGWTSPAEAVASVSRLTLPAETRRPDLGFRLARAAR